MSQYDVLIEWKSFLGTHRFQRAIGEKPISFNRPLANGTLEAMRTQEFW